MCAAPGSDGESPVRESTAAVQEPQPKNPLQAAARSCPRTLSCQSPLSCESRLTFHIHSQQWMVPNRGEKILVFHSNVMALDISGNFWGKYRFYLNSDYSPILYLFIWFVAIFSPMIFAKLFVLLWYVDNVYNKDHQRWYRFPLLFGVLWNLILYHK